MELPLDSNKEVVVTMKAEGIIKGQVVDARTGKLLPRFTFQITCSSDVQPDEPASVIVNDQGQGREFASPLGQFLLKGLQAGIPLQVNISAEGYRRQVVRRVVAKTASEAQPVTIRLTAEDPTKLVTVRGKIVNHRGEPVAGAVLHLTAATDRTEPRDESPFNWQTIESGQTIDAPNVLQVQSRTTAADGSFVFQRVPGDAEIELVYWAKGVPPGRLDHLEKLPEKQRTEILIKTPAPARISATIDRQVFPEIGSIMLSGVPQFYRATLSADGKSFVMDGLPAGSYVLAIYGLPARVARREIALGHKSVTLDAGKEEKISFGEADRALEGSP
jgi:hypothetical protein